MNYVKKMCILRQIKQGFSGDGKTLSGLIKMEQYGKNLAVEVSIINFAPLVSGEYYCLLSDGKGKTEMLSLRGKSIFNILSDMDISAGFCGIICYVKTEITPIAYGINGNGSYDWRAILNKTTPPVFPREQEKSDSALAKIENLELFNEENEPTMYEMNVKTSPLPKAEDIPVAELVEEPAPALAAYDDEAVANENYFEEKKDECVQSTTGKQDESTENSSQAQGEKAGSDPAPHGNAPRLLEKAETDAYYLSVRGELDGLFARYPKDKSLCDGFTQSEWVRIRGTAKAPQYLVGAVYEEGKVAYICYALAAKEGEEAPEEIKGVCSFVPTSPFVGAEGFFVIFQSAATGECVKPPRK